MIFLLFFFAHQGGGELVQMVGSPPFKWYYSAYFHWKHGEADYLKIKETRGWEIWSSLLLISFSINTNHHLSSSSSFLFPKSPNKLAHFVSSDSCNQNIGVYSILTYRLDWICCLAHFASNFFLNQHKKSSFKFVSFSKITK